jgi:large subunit ribosomal protein L10
VNLLSKETVAVKAKEVEEVTEQLKSAVSAIVVDYRGLTVEQVTDLRKQLRDAGVKMRVIKNKIMVRAAEKAGYADLNDVFSGPTAVAFSEEDPVAPAKILANFAKTADALQLKGGVIEGKVASLEEVQEYATMPSREELLATIANLLQAPVRNVAYAVKAIAEKGDEDAA